MVKFKNKQVSFNGKIADFHPEFVGSTPTTCIELNIKFN